MSRAGRWAWLPPAAWMAVIFIFSTDYFSSVMTGKILLPLLTFFLPNLSGGSLDFLHFGARKIAHAVEYGILAALLFRMFSRTASPSVVPPALKSLLVVLAYAITDEFHQSFVPSRTPSLWDVGLDTAGGGLVILSFALLASSRRSLSARGAS